MRIPNLLKYFAFFFCIALVFSGCGNSSDGSSNLSGRNISEVPSSLVTLTFLPAKVLAVPPNVAFVRITGTDANGQAVDPGNGFPFPVTLNYTTPLILQVPSVVRHLHLDFLDANNKLVGIGDLDVNLSPNIPAQFNIPFTDGAPSAPVTILVPPPVPDGIVRLRLSGTDVNNAGVTTILPVFPLQVTLPPGGGQTSPVTIPVSVTRLRAEFIDGQGVTQASNNATIALTPEVAQTVTIAYPSPVETAPISFTFNLTQGANFYGQGAVPGNVTQIRISGSNGNQSVTTPGFPATVNFAAPGPVNVPVTITTLTLDFLTADNSLAGTNSVPFTATASTPQIVNVPFLVPTYLFSNFNAGGVSSGPPTPTVFSISRPWTLQQIHVYHFAQAAPTLLGLTDANGTTYGPYPVVGGVYPGTNTTLNVSMPAGTFTVTNDFPAGWSWDSESAGRGFTEVFGTVP